MDIDGARLQYFAGGPGGPTESTESECAASGASTGHFSLSHVENKRVNRALLFALATLAGTAIASPDSRDPAPPVDTVTVQRAEVPVVRTLNGVVEAVNEATVSAQTSGRVGEILYDVNDVVPAGAVIVRLRGKEQRADLDRAEAALEEAIARDAEARARYERFSDMYERRVVPKATFEEALAARDSARAQVAAARAAVERAREGVSYTEVRAPYGGVVTKRFVTVGESVSPGTPLMSGLSLDDLRVVVDVPQSLADAVRARQSAWVDVDGTQVPAETVTVFPVAEATVEYLSSARTAAQRHRGRAAGNVREGGVRHQHLRATAGAAAGRHRTR